MEIFGTILLAVMGIGFFCLTGYTSYKNGWKLSAVHPIFGSLSAIMVIAAFLPLTKFEIGASGLSAEIDRTQKRMQVLETIVSSESPETQGIIDTLSEGARSKDWVPVEPEAVPMAVSATSADGDDGFLGGGDEEPSDDAVPPTAAATTDDGQGGIPADVSPAVRSLAERGVVEVKERDDGEVVVKVNPEWADALE